MSCTGKNSNKMPGQSLKEICETAMEAGRRIDLSDCHYGETTGACAFLKRPTSYYFFLAGLAGSQNLTRTLEIGTNSGGSIMSISKGLDKHGVIKSQLVTVDIVRKNEEGFVKYPHVRRIIGDSLNEKVIEEAVALFDEEIDLLYLDAVHEYEHTKKNMDIYAGRLNPRYVVLDDIRQCDDMRKLWGDLKVEFKDRAFDASDISGRKGAGFGVIRRRA